jgi:hypothetical protein
MLGETLQNYYQLFEKNYCNTTPGKISNLVFVQLLPATEMWLVFE